MKTNHSFRRVLPMFMVAALLAPRLAPAAAETNEMKSFVSGNNAFAFNVYGALCVQTPGNLFFSPYSISTCLGMTYAGARGETEKQMTNALRFGANGRQIHPLFARMQRQLNAMEGTNGVRWNVANALWTQKGFPILPAFEAIVQGQYGGELNQADFQTEAEKARLAINEWVEGKTGGKITDLFKPGTMDDSTRLALVNAIYFKGRWARQFDPGKTTEATFSTTATQKIQAQFMRQTATFKYGEVKGMQLIELPYAGGELSMVILLPDLNYITMLDTALSEATLDFWLGSARERKVEVLLPKFKVTGEFRLEKMLEKMGMLDAFSEKANFSGMTGIGGLFISAVAHKAFVEVNEEGTEAAAATGAAMGLTSAGPEPPVFRADHPFIFLIRDTKSGSILFLGRVMDPTK